MLPGTGPADISICAQQRLLKPHDEQVLKFYAWYTQVSGSSAVGITNSTFLGNLNANAQGGALCVGSQGLVQVCISQKWTL